MSSSSSASAPRPTLEPGEEESRKRWRYSQDELVKAPSLTTMDPRAYEIEKRKASEVIVRIGSRLYRRLEVVTGALVLLQRYYVRRHIQSLPDPTTMAAACLFLSSKIDESAKRPLADLATELLRYRGDVPEAHILDRTSRPFLDCEEALIVAERALLQATEYDLELPLPWVHLQPSVKALSLPEGVERLASKVCNEALRTTMVLEYTMREIAHASIWTALQQGGASGVPPADALPGLFSVLTTPVATMEAIRERVKESFAITAAATAGMMMTGSFSSSSSGAPSFPAAAYKT
jgi:Cyclin, N-terminal domain